MKKLLTILSVVCLTASSTAYGTPRNQNTLTSGSSSTSTATGGAGGSSNVKVSVPVLTNQGNNGYNTFSGMNWNNDNGFGGGVYCRTPSLFLGGNASPTTGAYGETTGHLNEYSVSAGVMVPFGSRSLEDCKQLATEITRQRKIDVELSTLRACAEVKRLGVTPDVKKYPNLAACVD